MKKTISIIILTYKPNVNLLHSLNKLSDINVTGAYSMEVLIINTISRIKINDLLKKSKFSFRLKIINIKKNQFNYGDTRNLGIDRSKGEYIIFLSSDAYPIGDNFINYFIEDLRGKKVVAVFGEEVAPEKNPKDFQYFEHLLWFKQYEPYYDKKNRVLFSQKIRDKSKNSDDIFFWYSLSNVFSCYKRSFLEKHHFKTMFYGEDVLMGKFIIENGFEMMFDSRCQVEHLHNGLKNYVIRNIEDWYFRIFVLKSGLHIKIQDKINLEGKENKSIINIIEIYFYYFIKAFILIAIFLIKLKQMILTFLIEKKKDEYIKKYI